MSTILSFPEALALVAHHAASTHPRAVETLPLLEAANRVLAQDILADRDQPPFHRSTRDGFAVRAADWTSSHSLTLIGELPAGQLWLGLALASGQAIEIMTGAPLPAGADSVAMLEHADHTGSHVRASPCRTLRPGENVVPRGSEATEGSPILRTGTVITAAEIAAAAACGHTHLPVFARPRVAILATGDELVELGDLDHPPEPWQIRNSNSYALAALVASAGGEPIRLSIARDTQADIATHLTQALTADLILLSGGVSAGKYDLVEHVLADLHAEFLFIGVKMQPGRPAVFGRLSKSASQQVSEPAANNLCAPGLVKGTASAVPQPLAGEGGALAPEVPPTGELCGSSEDFTYFFGLPGNPISTEVTFHCFVAPMLRALAGATDPPPRFALATLTEDVPTRPGLTRLLPARVESSFTHATVHLVPWQGSGDLAANARANCYAVLPDALDLHSGDTISILLR